jgi:hypothetical protein
LTAWENKTTKREKCHPGLMWECSAKSLYYTVCKIFGKTLRKKLLEKHGKLSISVVR